MNVKKFIKEVLNNDCYQNKLHFKEKYVEQIVSIMEINYDIIVTNDSVLDSHLSKLLIDEIQEFINHLEN